MEKSIDNHLRTTTLRDIALHHAQHAYREARSTKPALFQLSDILRNTIDNKEVALWASLDIEGAFDNTSHEAVDWALCMKRVEKPVWVRVQVRNWMSYMLKNRLAETVVGNETIQIRTTKWYRQGGVLLFSYGA